jgi:hypothetical protein
MKHKHAELIKKWADGAKIQIKSENDDWEDVDPAWIEHCEYRIKPEYNQSKGTRMNKEEIIEMARQAGFVTNEIKSYVISPYTFEDQDLYQELEAFAKLVAEKEREQIYAEQLQLPEPRLTGKFKCTSCTGTWTDRDDAKLKQKNGYTEEKNI